MYREAARDESLYQNWPLHDEQSRSEASSDYVSEPDSATPHTDAACVSTTHSPVSGEASLSTVTTGARPLSLSFEGLPWEVECTEDVWKYLGSRKVDQILRKKILLRVHRIASGEWQMYLAHRVKAKDRPRISSVSPLFFALITYLTIITFHTFYEIP